jgi:hypothetical protein
MSNANAISAVTTEGQSKFNDRPFGRLTIGQRDLSIAARVGNFHGLYWLPMRITQFDTGRRFANSQKHRRRDS